MAMQAKTFEKKLATWSKNAASNRDELQGLIELGLDFYLDSKDSLRITNVVQTFGEVYGLTQRGLMVKYIEKRSPSLVYTDLEHGFSFKTRVKRGSGKMDATVLPIGEIGTWWQWKDKANDEKKDKPKSFNAGSRIKAVATALNKALDDTDTTIEGLSDVDSSLALLNQAIERLNKVKANGLANLK